MKHLKLLQYAFGMGLALLFLVGCSSIMATPIPPTPTPGVGVPVTAGHWEVTITNVRQENEWSTYKPKDGYIFLVLDAAFHNLDSTQETTVANDTVAIVGADGKINPATGFGIPNNSHIDTINGDKSISITGGMGFVPSLGSESDQLSVTLVFILPKDNIGKTVKFQFQDIHIPFSVN